MKPRVYLAGVISGLSFSEANTWREIAQKKLALYGIVGCSPLRGKDHLEDETVLHKAGYEGNPMSTKRGITTRDRFDVMNSDVVIMNLTGAESVSIGCMIEIGWSDANRKPVILVMEKGNPHEGHAMLDECTQYKVHTVDEAVEVARKILVYDL